MNFLIEFLSDFCSKLDSLDKLYQAVALIKKNISPNVPWQSSAEFHTRFLRQFEVHKKLQGVCDVSYKRAALEIIFDTEIEGLDCRDLIDCLERHDAHRIRRITELEISPVTIPYSLDNFNLQFLTKFCHAGGCTDTDLEIVGQNCSKLEELSVGYGDAITDLGLSFLAPCSELRILGIDGCSRVSHRGIREFLSVHKKIGKLSAWPDAVGYGFDCFSEPDLSVYPSISHFSMESVSSSRKQLLSIVEKFPNLILIEFSGDIEGDLRILRCMNKLSHLHLGKLHDIDWDNLKQLLGFIGANIVDLRTFNNDVPYGNTLPSHEVQNYLNFVFNACGNIESLTFEFEPEYLREKLVIPPFKKLKFLECCAEMGNEYDQREIDLEFRQMLNLETLIINGFVLAPKTMESMIFDNSMFPNLKEFHILEFVDSDVIERIRLIAKENNLDVRIITW